MIKKILGLSLMIGLTAVFSGCVKDDPDGLWGDNIHLSAKKAVLKATSDSVSFSTKGSWWWIDDISLNGCNTDFNRSEVHPDSSSYSIEGCCFVVERRNSQTLFVKMEDNNTGHERKLQIHLEAGDYFDAVNITQAAR